VLQGIFPVIPTLFTNRNELDLAAQRRVIRFALDAGAHGLVFPGVASEYSHLALPEREQLLALVAEEAGGKVPLVGGASAPTANEVIAAGTIAMRHGIRHLMIMAPVGLKADVAAHRAFFQQVAAGLPGAEIILQNAPVPTGAGLDAKAIIEIAAAIPAITFIKEETLPSGPAITALRGAAIPSVRGVFGGGGARYIIDELDRGACGAMPAVELTDLHVALWNAYAAGDREQARREFRNAAVCGEPARVANGPVDDSRWGVRLMVLLRRAHQVRFPMFPRTPQSRPIFSATLSVAADGWL
jgi:4-hydroxy-tetrahydrodipicolinate synthase